MKIIGLTGNIGSGKTTIAQVFTFLNVPVFSADVEAKKILQSDVVKNQLIEIFGAKIVNAEKMIDTSRLASIVFNDDILLKKLNAIIHPLLWKLFETWIKTNKQFSYVVIEAAILFESGYYKKVDKIVVVSAPQELCIDRVIKRDDVSREAVLKRIQKQWDEKLKISKADYVIFNNDKQLVIPQVVEIHQELLAKC